MSKQVVKAGLVAAAALVCVVAQAATVTLVDTGQSYLYKDLGHSSQADSVDLWTNWAGVGLSTYESAAANANFSWQTGQSAFGNNGGLPQNTNWAADHDLALTTTFSLASSDLSSLTLKVASDNGFLVFLNDNLLAKENAEGYTSYWEYSFSEPTGYLLAGTNTLKILAEDHGGATFFDMQLTGTVPEPASLALVGLALLGAGAARRRN